MNSANHILSPSGLAVQVNSNGSIRRMDCGDIMINLFLGNEMEGGLSNIFLRRYCTEKGIESLPLIGPGSPASYEFDEQGFSAMGQWRELAFRARLILATSETAWFWHITLKNLGETPLHCDLIYTQDVGLAHYGAIRLNEFYISQYIDHTAIEDPSHGIMIASRQNQSMGGCHPWSVIGSLRRGISYATDALQFYGLSMRTVREPRSLGEGLPGQRLQHEHALVALQDAPFDLKPGQTAQAGCCGVFIVDMPDATQTQDRKRFLSAMALPEANPTPWVPFTPGQAPAQSLFRSAEFLETSDLEKTEIDFFWSQDRRHEERRNDRRESFFCAKRSHVVFKAKELRVLRPHGHILRSGSALMPDEAALTSTVWMNGVFHSMVTQGHVSINRFLSTCHSYLSLFRSYGQRVFIELGGAWRLLDTPSAFEMRPRECRWIYKHSHGLVEVVAKALADRHALKLALSILEGEPARFLIAHHVAINGDNGSSPMPASWQKVGEEITMRPIADSDVGRRFPNGAFVIRMTDVPLVHIGGDEMLFEDGISRSQPFLCILTAPTREVGLDIEGRLIQARNFGTGVSNPSSEVDLGDSICLQPPIESPLASAVLRVGEILPWFIHNALVHYLSPRGLEQYSGGGWGTRDVCQGPIELLLALGRWEPIRDLLTRVFKQQNTDGDWPQWFMFYDRERTIRPDDSHGDIVYWPILALAQYLCATGDGALLKKSLPYYHPQGDEQGEHGTIWEHVERALAMIRRRVIPGTPLAAYGHGDWNDALQPAKPEMRERLCSSWTVTLNYQTLAEWARALAIVGEGERSQELLDEAAKILAAFHKLLIADDVVAGLVDFHSKGERDFLLHPKDKRTGLSYSLLPMIHAIINDMFTPAEAKSHLSLIEQHLVGPDGARLFNAPLPYCGGMQTLFQRAESAAYFGREIGLMYTHAHLRYCEALARYGDAAAFFHALQQAIPIGLKDVVPPAMPRQANCYYSSSDAAFHDRYDAFDHYGAALRGEIPLEGGWRIYSSGPGIAVRLILQCFLGIRLGSRAIVIDPVIPRQLNGLRVRIDILNRPIEIAYCVGSRGSGPLDIRLNGQALICTREKNIYRPGGLRVDLSTLRRHLYERDNHMVVSIA